jgi:hypothetical protein
MRLRRAHRLGRRLKGMGDISRYGSTARDVTGGASLHPGAFSCSPPAA